MPSFFPSVRMKFILLALAVVLPHLSFAQTTASEDTTIPVAIDSMRAQIAADTAQTPAAPPPTGFTSSIDNAAGVVVRGLAAVLFYPIGPFPAIVLWLIIGAVFLTFYMGFVNLRGFKHAIELVRGKYTNPNEAGEVTHFQALSSALSATVGLGNIAGVAIAVSIGGPGATFWMIVAGFLGMSSKFAECTLGQMYRKIDEKGRVSGGAMHYLHDGFKERGMGGIGKALSVLFAICCIGGSFGGGNMFQIGQSLGGITNTIPALADYNWAYGLLMVGMVGIVIIGGIKRIAQTAEKIVPFMCGIYVLAALVILFMHFSEIPAAFATIISGAFTPEAGYGGIIGVLVQGFRRATFSNEAGVGSAPIAHSAAKTDIPIREGFVALLEPFIDTVVVCTMTALVIVITGAYNAGGAFEAARAAGNGGLLTSLAFQERIPWFPYILSLAVFLFAYSTCISWSYYGERSWTYLFGPRSSIIYKVLFLVFVFLGAIITAQNIIDFSDLMIFSMSLPNMIGLYLMAPKVRRTMKDYFAKLKAGEFKVYS